MNFINNPIMTNIILLVGVLIFVLCIGFAVHAYIKGNNINKYGKNGKNRKSNNFNNKNDEF